MVSKAIHWIAFVFFEGLIGYFFVAFAILSGGIKAFCVSGKFFIKFIKSYTKILAINVEEW